MGKLEPKKCRFVDFSKRVVALKLLKFPGDSLYCSLLLAHW